MDQTLISQRKLEEEVCVLKYDLIETFEVYFEWDNEQKDFFHPRLHLSGLNVFKIIHSG